MLHQFSQHYTRNEARALLPQVRQWLERLDELRAQLLKQDERLVELLEPGRDVGGDEVNRWVRMLADVKATLREFGQREIQIKDLERGLVDFPAVIDGKEVFLCWEKSEADIDFYHDLETGYSGRQKLEEEE